MDIIMKWDYGQCDSAQTKMFSATGCCNQVVRNIYIPKVNQICIKDALAILFMWHLRTCIATTMSMEDCSYSRTIRWL